MQQQPSMQVEGKCNALTRSGRPCSHEAGWGTDHTGAGRCKMHGGSSPSGAMAGATELARAYMDADSPLPDVTPIDALLYCVQRASQRAMYARRMQRRGDGDGAFDEKQLDDQGRPLPWSRVEAEQLRDLARFSKMALDAGVAERQVRIAERMGAAISAALEQALQGVDLPGDTRAQIVGSFSSQLMALERGVD